jgi:hypothetical protein
VGTQDQPNHRDSLDRRKRNYHYQTDMYASDDNHPDEKLGLLWMVLLTILC